ncbi:TetR/AcrR family transcriptional regulator [Actinomycetospora aeridis]|uniref:TetR/AcrR family transcriptional regulator n=1 Tax=Actinomycetospora aeridis TaxID=3129231 RepID=A0ABU8N418_9PSEU
MSSPSRRRTEALSRERIVDAAVALLDEAGEGGLTFRALSQALATGPGAIYHHVANKEELLAAATDAVVAGTLAGEPEGSPRDNVRALALGLFDAIDEHPWVAGGLTASSWQATSPRIFERVGRQVRDLGVPQDRWFTVTSVLMQYILGAAAQNAANARILGPDVDRDEFLGAVSTTWEELDADEYSFTRTVADQMRSHDDREQFLEGIDLVLAGIGTTVPGTGTT